MLTKTHQTLLNIHAGQIHTQSHLIPQETHQETNNSNRKWTNTQSLHNKHLITFPPPPRTEKQLFTCPLQVFLARIRDRVTRTPPDSRMHEAVLAGLTGADQGLRLSSWGKRLGQGIRQRWWLWGDIVVVESGRRRRLIVAGVVRWWN